MTLEPRRKSKAAKAFEILHAGLDSSTEALATLRQYIKHLEELLLVELGRDEFTQRLQSLQRRDEESLFIPEDNTIIRKRGSTSTESGSSPKKSRSDSSASSLSLTSGLGRSILDKAKSESSDSSAPDVSPKTSRKLSVTESAGVDCQKATAKQMALRSVYPIPQFRRGSQSALLPNTHPSSNFHSGPSAPSAAETSQGLPTAQRPQKQLSSTSMRRDSVQSEGVSKNDRTGSTASVHNATTQDQTLPKSLSKTTTPNSRPAVPKLSRKPTFSSVQSLSSSLSSSSTGASSLVDRPSPSPGTLSTSSAKLSSSFASGKPSSSVSSKLSSPVSTNSSSTSVKPSSVSSKPSSVSSKPSSSVSSKPYPFSEALSTSSSAASSEEPSSFKRKPWRAAKKG